MGSVLLLAMFAGSAAAHTPSASLTCEGGLKVDLTYYEVPVKEGDSNTVAVSIDGEPVSGSPFTFTETFSQTWAVNPPTQPHTAIVDVKAWDDPTGSEGWTVTYNLEIPACQQPTPTATAKPTPTATQPETTSTPKPTPKPSPSGTNVPATGTPRITPPPTDGTGTTGGPGTGLPLVLLLLIGSSVAMLPISGRRIRNR